MRKSRKTHELPKRFLRAEEIDEAIAEVSALARSTGAHVALAGGCAMQIYGSQRLTVDVDVVASGPVRGLKPTVPLTFGGYSSVTSAGTTVDVMICNNEYEEAFDAALERAVRKRGVPLPVVRPEHLAVMKMIAGRKKDEVDLAWLVTSGTLDTEKTARIVRELLGHYAAREFRNFSEEAQWLKDRGRE
jgi:hypothetical protein